MDCELLSELRQIRDLLQTGEAKDADSALEKVQLLIHAIIIIIKEKKEV